MYLSRRKFLRATGISLALPCLDCFASGPSNAKHQTQNTKHQTPYRMVCICMPLGLHPSFFFPQKAGKDYALTPYLEVLEDLRDDFTVISGLSHPEIGNSHDSIF